MNAEELRLRFRLTETGSLERLFHGKYWRPVKNKDNTNLGYCRVSLNQGDNPIQYHRIVYMLTTGKDIPKGYEIDHINGDTLDNRFCNLRLVTHRENTINKISHRKGRLPGATFSKQAQKWVAVIWIKGVSVWIGSFATELEASEAYLAKMREVIS